MGRIGIGRFRIYAGQVSAECVYPVFVGTGYQATEKQGYRVYRAETCQQWLAGAIVRFALYAGAAAVYTLVYCCWNGQDQAHKYYSRIYSGQVYQRYGNGALGRLCGPERTGAGAGVLYLENDNRYPAGYCNYLRLPVYRLAHAAAGKEIQAEV